MTGQRTEYVVVVVVVVEICYEETDVIRSVDVLTRRRAVGVLCFPTTRRSDRHVWFTTVVDAVAA